MLTPKEKAKELVDKFCEYSHTDFDYSRGGYQFDSQIQNAKQCALISVDEMIEWSKQWVDEEILAPALIYLENVKKEIEKL